MLSTSPLDNPYGYFGYPKNTSMRYPLMDTKFEFDHLIFKKMILLGKINKNRLINKNLLQKRPHN